MWSASFSGRSVEYEGTGGSDGDHHKNSFGKGTFFFPLGEVASGRERCLLEAPRRRFRARFIGCLVRMIGSRRWGRPLGSRGGGFTGKDDPLINLPGNPYFPELRGKAFSGVAGLGIFWNRGVWHVLELRG